jgi:hypothetical protein
MTFAAHPPVPVARFRANGSPPAVAVGTLIEARLVAGLGYEFRLWLLGVLSHPPHRYVEL